MFSLRGDAAQSSTAKLQHCSRSQVGPCCIRFQHCLTQRWLCKIQPIKMHKGQRDLWLGHRLLPWLQHHSSLTGLVIRLSYLSAAHYTPTTLDCSPGGRRMRLLTPGRRRWSPPCPLVWGGWSINSMPSTPDLPMFWSRSPSNDGGHEQRLFLGITHCSSSSHCIGSGPDCSSLLLSTSFPIQMINIRWGSLPEMVALHDAGNRRVTTSLAFDSDPLVEVRAIAMVNGKGRD